MLFRSLVYTYYCFAFMRGVGGWGCIEEKNNRKEYFQAVDSEWLIRISMALYRVEHIQLYI